MERAIETLLGSYLLIRVFGSNASSRYRGFTGDLYINSIYLSFFYVASGFFVSTLYFGLWRRSDNPVIQSSILAGAFIFHLVLFLFLGQIDLDSLAILVFFGATIVFLSNFAGSVFFDRIRS